MKNGSVYQIIECGLLGKTGYGTAMRNDRVVTLDVTNTLLGRYVVDLCLEGDRLEGALELMGFSVPFILSRRKPLAITWGGEMADGPADPNELIERITRQDLLVRKAFSGLIMPHGDTLTRCEAHHEYRVAASMLLELQLQDNAMNTGAKWDIQGVVQPLVQQTLIEASLVESLGDNTQARALRDQAIALAETHLTGAALARIHRDKAAQLASDGRFNQALTLLSDVRRIFMELHDTNQYAQTALDEARVVEWLGDYDRALNIIAQAEKQVRPLLSGREPGRNDVATAIFKEAMSIFSGKGSTAEADNAVALWRIALELREHEASIRKELNQYDDSERLYRGVLAEYRSLGSAGAAVEFKLAAIDAARGQYDAALETLTRIEPEFEEGLLRPRRCALRTLQAEIELGRDPASGAALHRVEEGLADLADYPDLELRWKLQWRRGQALETTGRAPEALEAFEEALDTIDSLRKTPLGYRLDSTYLSSKLPVFDRAIDLAEQQRAAASCARFIEMAKARALSAVLSVPHERLDARSDLEAEFDRITERLDGIEYEGYRATLTSALADERDHLVRRRRELTEQIRLRDPRWRSLSEPPPFNPCQLSAMLAAADRAALTLYVRQDRIVSVLLAGGECTIASQPIGDQLATALDEYSINLVKPQPDVFEHDFSEWFPIGAADLVPRDLLERALSASSLVIAPHRNLHLLPWSALLLDQRRLFEWTPIGVLPNLSCLTAIDGEFSPRPRAALIGNPDYSGLKRVGDLPQTAAEITDLEKAYSDRARLLVPAVVGRNATEAALRTLLAREDAEGAILHVSCHGSLDIQEPLGSGLLLTDSKLDAGELALMRTHYEEIVLSACSTGWRPQAVEGITLTGDDVLGLPGSLLEAGARSVLVSIPKANDAATRAFMAVYHGHRLLGMTPLRAFRATQMEMNGSTDYPPSAWVGFVCYATR